MSWRLSIITGQRITMSQAITYAAHILNNLTDKQLRERLPALGAHPTTQHDPSTPHAQTPQSEHTSQ